MCGIVGVPVGATSRFERILIDHLDKNSHLCGPRVTCLVDEEEEEEEDNRI
jgi:hypothetical protein